MSRVALSCSSWSFSEGHGWGHFSVLPPQNTGPEQLSLGQSAGENPPLCRGRRT